MFVINRGFSDYNSIAFSREVDGVLYGAKAEKLDGVVEVHRIRVLNVGPIYRVLDHETRIKYIKARLMAILTILLLGVGAWMMPYKKRKLLFHCSGSNCSSRCDIISLFDCQVFGTFLVQA